MKTHEAVEADIPPEGPWPIGEHQVTLSIPKSFAIRHELVAAINDHPVRACAACLAACWQGPGRPKDTYAQCKYDPLRYGAAVIDELVARKGVTMAQVMKAGMAAFKLLAPTVLTEQEVQSRAGFSTGGKAPSTS
jgi:hypothetical protein